MIFSIHERKYTEFNEWLNTPEGQNWYDRSFLWSMLTPVMASQIKTYVVNMLWSRELGYAEKDFTRFIYSKDYILAAPLRELCKLIAMDKTLDDLLTNIDTNTDNILTSTNEQDSTRTDSGDTISDSTSRDNNTSNTDTMSETTGDSTTKNNGFSGNSSSDESTTTAENTQVNDAYNNRHTGENFSESETNENSNSKTLSNGSSTSRSLNSDMPHSNVAPITTGLDVPTNWKYASGQNDSSSQSSETGAAENVGNSTNNQMGGTFGTDEMGEQRTRNNGTSKTVSTHKGNTTDENTSNTDTNSLTNGNTLTRQNGEKTNFTKGTSINEMISKVASLADSSGNIKVGGRTLQYSDFLTAYTQYIQELQTPGDWLLSQLDDLFVQVY